MTRAAGALPPGERARVAVRDLPAAAFARRPRDDGLVAGSKLTICLWLLRKAVKVTGWLLLAAAAAAAWPVTLVAAAGYGAAWLRGWPPARLRRAAAWSLPVDRASAGRAGGTAAPLAAGRAGPGAGTGSTAGSR